MYFTDLHPVDSSNHLSLPCSRSQRVPLSEKLVMNFISILIPALILPLRFRQSVSGSPAWKEIISLSSQRKQGLPCSLKLSRMSVLSTAPILALRVEEDLRGTLSPTLRSHKAQPFSFPVEKDVAFSHPNAPFKFASQAT